MKKLSSLAVLCVFILASCTPTAPVGRTMTLDRAIEYSMKSIVRANHNLNADKTQKIGLYPETVVVKFNIKDIDERSGGGGATGTYGPAAVKVDFSRKASNEASNNIEITFKSIYKAPGKPLPSEGVTNFSKGIDR